ncbi:UNVERIFIED_ORG: flagellar hook-length control protein [Escherichia phage CMSTMSU]
MSPAKLNVLQTATFGDSSLSTYGITGNGLNKLDYVTISGNAIQSPTTPLLEVTKGKTKVVDLEVTGVATIPNIESSGTANFNNINVSGTIGGSFDLDDIQATTLSVSGASALTGAVTLGANITGLASTATFKAINLGQNTADANVKLGFAYTAPSARPTVLLANEVQSELMSPAKLNVLQTATFGSAALSTYGITGNGLNKLDYLTITGNATQNPATPQLQVGGKAILNDVEFTGTVTGLTVDVSGQDLTPKSVVAAEAIKGQTLESVGQTTVGSSLQVGGTATVTGALSAAAGTFSGDVSGSKGIFSDSVSGTSATFTGDVSGDNATFSGDLSAVAGTFSGDVTVTGQTITVKDLVVTGTSTGVTAIADVDGLDIAPNKVDVTTTLSVAGESTLAGVTATSINSTGAIAGTAISGSTITATGEISGASSVVTGLSKSGSVETGALKASSVETAIISNTAGVSITNNTSIAGNLSVTGTVTPCN